MEMVAATVVRDRIVLKNWAICCNVSLRRMKQNDARAGALLIVNVPQGVPQWGSAVVLLVFVRLAQDRRNRCRFFKMAPQDVRIKRFVVVPMACNVSVLLRRCEAQ